MRKYLSLVVCLGVVSGLPAMVFAQDETAAAESFKAIARNVDDFFSTSPVVLESSTFSSSPSGMVHVVHQFEKLGESSFDVRKTDSLISPYTAYIRLKLEVRSNRLFGDVVDKTLGTFGFRTKEDALRTQRFGSCLGTSSDFDEPQLCIGDVDLRFAYQDQAWVFKGVETELGESVKIKAGSARYVLKSVLPGNPEWQKAWSRVSER